MKIRLLSDLHLEFEELPIRQGGEDLVVLAGDIGLGISGIEWAKETFRCPVIYVAGNHEFYGHHFDGLIPDLRVAAAGTNVHFLENDVVVIGNVRFIGATLWTDFGLYGNPLSAMEVAKDLMHDFKIIKAMAPEGQGRLQPLQTAKRFHESSAAIKRLVEVPFDGKTVVVTHHLPTESSVAKKYKGDRCNPAFASNLDEFILLHPAIGYWMHGHTHESVDVMVGATRILCNPGGYPYGGKRENPAFELECVISL
jgi:predicted phosphodiesterase